MTSPVVAESDLLAVDLPPQPYPGLRPFEMSEWAIFFGREAMIDEIIELMGQQSMVVVHGSSGAGKSSLIRAGVLPRLARQHRRSRVPLLTCAIRPSGGPLWNLASALGELEAGRPDLEVSDSIRREFDRPNANLANIVASRPALAGKRLCILIDQFEEIFRYAKETSRDEVELLIDLLRSVIDDEKRESPLHILITMRSEFLGECARLPELAQAINRAQYLLPPMEHASLIRAIRRPAELYGGTIDEALAERLIMDGQQEPDELPLIQHALMLMWRQARELRAQTQHDGASTPEFTNEGTFRLRLDTYVARGGLVNMLNDHADQVADMAAPSSEPRKRRVLELLFRTLTDINSEGHAIRSPKSFRTLSAVTGSDEETVRAIVDAFRAEGTSFLTPYAPAPIEPSTVIDISHEALIRSWIRISDPHAGWLQAEFRDGQDWRILRARSSEGSLLSETAIPEREAWLNRLNAPWSERYGGGWAYVHRLMEDSRVARDRARRARRIRHLAGVGMGLIALGVGGLYTWDQGRQAKEKAKLAEMAVSAEVVASERAKKAEAVNLWHPLIMQDTVNDAAKSGLLALAKADVEQRSLFVAEILRIPALATRLSETDIIVRALMGLSADRRDLPVKTLAKSLTPNAQPEVFAALAKLAGTAQVVELAPQLIEATRQISNVEALAALSEGLADLADRLSLEQAKQATSAIVDAIEQTKDMRALGRLVGAFAALPAEWTHEHAARVSVLTVEALRRERNSWATTSLNQGLIKLADKLTQDQGTNVALALVSIIQTAPIDPFQRIFIGQALQANTKGLSGEHAERVADVVIGAIQSARDFYTAEALAIGFRVLAPSLRTDQTALAADVLIAAFEETTFPTFWSSQVMSAAAALPDQAGRVSAALAVAVQRTSDPYQHNLLLDNFYELGKLTLDQIVEAMVPISEAMLLTTNQRTLRTLGKGLSILAGKLKAGSDPAAANLLVDALQKSTDPHARAMLSKSLAILSITLSPSQKASYASLLVDSMRAADPISLAGPLQAYSALISELAFDESEQARALISEAIHNTRDPIELGILGLGLASLADKLSQNQREMTIEVVTEGLRRTTDPDAVHGLVRGLIALSIELDSAQASNSATLLTEAIGRTNDRAHLEVLGETLKALTDKLSSVQAELVADNIVDLVQNGVSLEQANVLAEALNNLSSKLTTEQAIRVATHVIHAVRKTTDYNAQYKLNEVLASLATRISPDAAMAILVFEVLKYPWLRAKPFADALESRFGKLPTSSSSIWPMVEWAQARFPGIIDFEGPPKEPEEIATAVRQATSRSP